MSSPPPRLTVAIANSARSPGGSTASASNTSARSLSNRDLGRPLGSSVHNPTEGAAVTHGESTSAINNNGGGSATNSNKNLASSLSQSSRNSVAPSQARMAALVTGGGGHDEKRRSNNVRLSLTSPGGIEMELPIGRNSAGEGDGVDLGGSLPSLAPGTGLREAARSNSSGSSRRASWAAGRKSSGAFGGGEGKRASFETKDAPDTPKSGWTLRKSRIKLFTKQTPLPVWKDTCREYRFCLRCLHFGLAFVSFAFVVVYLFPSHLNILPIRHPRFSRVEFGVDFIWAAFWLSSSISLVKYGACPPDIFAGAPRCSPWDMAFGFGFLTFLAYLVSCGMGLWDLAHNGWGSDIEWRPVGARGGLRDFDGKDTLTPNLAILHTLTMKVPSMLASRPLMAHAPATLASRSAAAACQPSISHRSVSSTPASPTPRLRHRPASSPLAACGSLFSASARFHATSAAALQSASSVIPPGAAKFSSATGFAPVHTGSGPEHPNPPVQTTLYITIKDKVGALDDLLGLIRLLNISLTRIESRPSKTKGYYDFFIDFNAKDMDHINAAVDRVRMFVSECTVVSGDHSEVGKENTPWFPRKISDLDSFAEKVLSYGQELDSDHPGFLDKNYRARREEITTIAKTYRHGQILPRIDYTPTEIQTWGTVFNKLKKLFPTHACKEHQYVFPLLIQNCGYTEDNIPQLEDVSRFLKDCTGWSIRPVMGLLSSRDFLNGLAFRVFHSTQYIRHHSMPLYTPEPDVCHELLGHVPLYADPDFADFSQEIGLASLGASDADLEKLATIYWFTVEFGLCKEGDKLKAFGAGLLSSFGELEYCLSGEPKTLPFDPAVTAVTEYPITSYQPLYFVAESFADMKEKVKEFAIGLKRPFIPRHNALTQSIELLDNKDKITRYANLIRGDLARLTTAIDKVM
ncbi:hypothetical protein HK101_010286 [Irineochytrium annulatum]|nr:hypothetical protein HK101_010286 [Irineochytrium annulatum]